MMLANMDALRQTNQHGKMGSSSSGGNNVVHTQQGQGLAALLVMLAVLCFIVAYCCWGAPCCRAFCRRRCCCCHSGGGNDAESSPSDLGLSVDQGMVATPTIILLPYGRMLVVDGSVFAQLQADTSGLDLIELGENVVRAQRPYHPTPTPTITLNSLADSNPSILEVDSETNSKDGCLSPVSLSGMPPPTYESLFGSQGLGDLPPSYEEILRQLHAQYAEASQQTEPAAPVAAPEDTEEPEEEYQPGEIRESRV